MPRSLLLVALGTGLAYLPLAFWVGPMIAADAGGQPVFDLRPGGYGRIEAIAFFEQISDDGRRLYRNLWFPLDMAFLLLLSTFFVMAFARLLPGRDPLLRALLFALPLLYGLTDAMENLLLFAAMKYGLPQLQDGVMEFAGFLTRVKFALFVLCGLILLGAVLHRLVSRAGGGSGGAGAGGARGAGSA